MTRQHRKAHRAVRSEQTLRKAVREAQQQPPPPRRVAPALPAATPRVRARKGKR